MLPDSHKVKHTLLDLRQLALKMVTEELTVNFAALKIAGCVMVDAPQLDNIWPIFSQYMFALPCDIATGTSRAYFSAKQLRKMDRVLCHYESQYRARLLENALDIIQKTQHLTL